MSKSLVKKRPCCPFCGQEVDPATDGVQRVLTEFRVGSCQCGAVYTSDPTGHNIGSAMVECLVYACGENWDFAWELIPGDDYLTGRIENYDEITHQVVDIKNVDGRQIRGVLYFVRLHAEMSEVAARFRGKQEKMASQASMPSAKQKEIKKITDPASSRSRKQKRISKQQVSELVAASDVDELVQLCLEDKKTLRLMQRLLYSPDEKERWATAWIIGQVCSHVSSKDPGQVAELLHRLFESCADSAATPWGMIETIGSIVSARPDIFGAFTKHLLRYVGHKSTQVQAIWALAEIAEPRPDLIRNMPFYSLFHFLNHPDSDVRGQLARLLGRIKASEVTFQLMGLKDDHGDLTIWERGKEMQTTVAQEAARAVRLIHRGEKNEEHRTG